MQARAQLDLERMAQPLRRPGLPGRDIRSRGCLLLYEDILDPAVQAGRGFSTRSALHPSTNSISSSSIFRVKHQRTATQLCVYSVKNRLTLLVLAVGPLAILPPVTSSGRQAGCQACEGRWRETRCLPRVAVCLNTPHAALYVPVQPAFRSSMIHSSIRSSPPVECPLPLEYTARMGTTYTDRKGASYRNMATPTPT